MGYSAVTGDRVSGTVRFTSVKEAFDVPPKVRVIALSSQNAATVANALEAYPNPAQDRLIVRTQLNSAAPMQVTMVDLMGKTVLRASVPTAQMQQAGVELNTSQLATGLYVVRVSTTEGSYTTKVTIQH
jgi:extracellular elastinolytic metalloproteinase